jgi:hypothetical protein
VPTRPAAATLGPAPLSSVTFRPDMSPAGPAEQVTGPSSDVGRPPSPPAPPQPAPPPATLVRTSSPFANALMAEGWGQEGWGEQSIGRPPSLPRPPSPPDAMPPPPADMEGDESDDPLAMVARISASSPPSVPAGASSGRALGTRHPFAAAGVAPDDMHRTSLGTAPLYREPARLVLPDVTMAAPPAGPLTGAPGSTAPPATEPAARALYLWPAALPINGTPPAPAAPRVSAGLPQLQPDSAPAGEVLLCAHMEVMEQCIRAALASAGITLGDRLLSRGSKMLEVLVTEGSAGHLWGSWRFSLTDLAQGIR